MSPLRKRQPSLPSTDPSWIDGDFVVIGIDNEAMPVSYRGEQLPFGLSRTIADGWIMQFLGRINHYRPGRGKPTRQLLDTSKQGVRQTGVTRCKTQLRLKAAPGTTGRDIWFEIYICWQETTGRELQLMDGPPPAAEEVPQK